MNSSDQVESIDECLILPDEDFEEFRRDLYEYIIQFFVISLLSIYLIGSYLFFCNFNDKSPFNANPLSDTMTFLRNISFLSISIFIFIVQKSNKINKQPNTLQAKNTMVLYFMIAPLMTVYSLNCILESSINIQLIHCRGYLFAFLEIFEGLLLIFILLMLNDIDKILYTNVSWKMRIANRLIALLIFVACIGIYSFQVTIRLAKSWGNITMEYYKTNHFIPNNCLKMATNNSSFYKYFQDYKSSTSFASTSYTICVIIFLLSTFKWLFFKKETLYSPSKTKNERDKIDKFDKVRIIPIIIIMVLIALVIIPLPFPKVLKKEKINLKNIFIVISSLFKIIGYTMTMVLSIWIIRLSKSWEIVEQNMSTSIIHQLFAWSGLLGHGFKFISNIMININFLTNNSKMNIILDSSNIVSIILQTYLIDIISKKVHKRAEIYTWADKIQPIFLLSGINLGFLINGLFEFLDNENAPVGISNKIINYLVDSFSIDFTFLQRAHASFYFLWLFLEV